MGQLCTSAGGGGCGGGPHCLGGFAGFAGFASMTTLLELGGAVLGRGLGGGAAAGSASCWHWC